MIITKCQKCGSLIHQADRCFLCGNTSEFVIVNSEVLVHENVQYEYSRLERLLKNGEFEEVLELSRTVLEWMPFCSNVFWIQLLAKNRCSTDESLIRKGVSCEDSAEYYNAVLFANETQKKVYTTVAAKILAVKNVLLKYIAEHEYSEKRSTAILKHQIDMSINIETYRNRLFQLWKNMKQVEHDIMVIEEDCLLLVKEHKEALDKSNSKAAAIKAETYKMDECTAEELHKYQTQFGNLLHQSGQAKATIDSIRKQHPWIENYKGLINKRDAIMSEINSEIKALQTYESRVQSTVSEIERIETRHKAAIADVTNYCFFEIRSLLGEARFISAFVEAGVK